MKIVVIGGTGLIGSKVVEKLGGRRALAARNDPRHVVTDPRAGYYGIKVSEATLVPGNDAQLGEMRFETWLSCPEITSQSPQYPAENVLKNRQRL
jgi:nucleoside-diphosphate-sugar epimerase